MKKILTALLALLPLSASANDFGTGIEVGAQKKITQSLSAGISGEFRTQDGVSNVERWSIGAELSYKICKPLKAEVGYTLIGRRIVSYDYVTKTKQKPYHVPGYWSPRHRAYISFTGSWKPIKHFELSLRERYQYTRQPALNIRRYNTATGLRGSDKVDSADEDHVLRSRLQLEWGKKKCPWQPFVSVEMLNDLTSSMDIDQMRYTAGTDYKLNKHNKIGISYRFKDKSDKDEAKGHLLSVSYSFSF